MTAKRQNKTVLIAGGAGFLGSHLCDFYIDKGLNVVCLDNLSTGRERNARHLAKHRNFEFVNADICKKLPSMVTKQKYVAVINMASPASPPQYQRLAIETLMAGSIGTLNLLDVANQSGARYFHASTSEVYGDPEVHPQTEKYWGKVHCYGPRSMYDESKRFSEALIFSYRKKYKLSTAIARFFNTYGPRMDPLDGRVVSNFIVEALRGDPITIYGNGSQTRSFCYVDDLVRGIALFINSNESGPMNLGNPGEFTISELAKKIVNKTGSKSSIAYLPLPKDDPTQRKPDTTLALKALGWKPTVKLDEGLDKTIEYFAKEITHLPTKGAVKMPMPHS